MWEREGEGTRVDGETRQRAGRAAAAAAETNVARGDDVGGGRHDATKASRGINRGSDRVENTGEWGKREEKGG